MLTKDKECYKVHPSHLGTQGLAFYLDLHTHMYISYALIILYIIDRHFRYINAYELLCFIFKIAHNLNFIRRTKNTRISLKTFIFLCHDRVKKAYCRSKVLSLSLSLSLFLFFSQNLYLQHYLKRTNI